MKNIDINLLVPNKNNPRIEIGDLTELTDSIRESGVLQNLTVVANEPDLIDTTYTVVIGHRRLAAAKLAGLIEVPCDIREMSAEEQQATMLLENMQRVDLSPYEEARGFQMCFDFGMTVDELKQKTGFSKKTIKHRMKILELDQNEVKDKQATLDDFILLESIEDLNERNRLLQFIGTNNFLYEVEKSKLKKQTNETTEIINESTKEVVAPKEHEIDNQSKIRDVESVASNLRINFMKDVFKNKIEKEVFAKAVAFNSEYLFENNYKINGDVNTFLQIVNKSSKKDLSAESIHKNKINYFIATTFCSIKKSDYLNIYDFLDIFNYTKSDDEIKLINGEL